MQADVWQNISSFATGGLLLVAIAGYTLDRRRERQERKEGQEKYRSVAEDLIRKQEKMHTENRERLEGLRMFRDFQEKLNQRRDDQMATLTTLAATQAEALKGFNRRLELVENGHYQKEQ